MFDRERVLGFRREGLSLEGIAARTGLGVGTVVRVVQGQTEVATAFQKSLP